MKIFTCTDCNYTTSKKTNIEKHINSEKHKKNIEGNSNYDVNNCFKRKKIKNKHWKNNTDNKHICELCRTVYNSYSGLWKHKQQCSQTDILTSSSTENSSIADSDNENDTLYDIDNIDDTTTVTTATTTDDDTLLFDPDTEFDADDDAADTEKATAAATNMALKIVEMFLNSQQASNSTQMDSQKQMNELLITTVTELKNVAIELKNSNSQNMIQNNNSNSHNNINNNTTNNKTTNKTTNKTIKNQINTQNNDIKFNMNMYLHEYCKNAINISDFFANIMANVNEKTYELFGRKGFVQGLTEVILQELKKYKDYERPFHCVDYRREIMVVKNENKWIKDFCRIVHDITSSIIGKGLFDISERNKYNVGQKDIREQAEFGVASCREKDIEIIRHSIGHYKTGNIERVISNIAKSSTIDKKGYVDKIKNRPQLSMGYQSDDETNFDEFSNCE